MLEKWETQGVSLILGKEKDAIVANDKPLILKEAIPLEAEQGTSNPYDDFLRRNSIHLDIGI